MDRVNEAEKFSTGSQRGKKQSRGDRGEASGAWTGKMMADFTSRGIKIAAAASNRPSRPLELIDLC